MDRFTFPRWTNTLRPALAVGLVGIPLYLVLLVAYGTHGKTTAVGYAPEQPIPYSHALHAGELGIDCRYCHSTVERGAMAAIPPTQVCMNCHLKVKASSEKLAPLRASFETGMPVPWIKVHDLPDYVYFNHSVHVSQGIGCETCHGRIDKMEVVRQVAPLTMGWCLDCHRHPEKALRPIEAVTAMDYDAGTNQDAIGRRLKAARGIRPSTDCVTCHR